MRIRRSAYVFFTCQERRFLDVELLLQGIAKETSARQLFGLSVLTSSEHPLSHDELAALLAIPCEDWIDAGDAGLGQEALDRLARAGVLITDAPEGELAELRRREERLTGDWWHPYSAFYHFMTKWRDVGFKFDLVDEPIADALDELGTPAPHFHSLVNGNAPTELPLVGGEGRLFELLRARRTTRSFDRDQPLAQEDLALLLYEVWGCHGYARVADDIVSLKKTSPSGGSLHPIEVYPIVLNVEGLAPGIYHYGVERHTLEPVLSLSREEAEAFANEMTSDQRYPQDAAVLFLMTTRFARQHWKYRHNNRTYSVMLMDAAHLSQTFYLVVAELGLGAFFTAAINGHNIEERLGLDGFAEAPLGVCGCGAASARDGDGPSFVPYTPRTSVLT